YTYRIAFGAGGGDYGLGAVVAMITFLMVAVISVFAFRWIRPLEEVHR
ncbi:MAG: ABC transporter permease, partial [Nitriliruptor sp.]